MPDEKTHADGLRAYLTGAASDGAAQTNPDASLGRYRAGSAVAEVGYSISSPIANIDVDFVASDNGPGAGTLTATGSDTVAWTPPGGSQGASVTILDGETKIIEGGGGELAKYARVSRTSATALTGTATVTIADTLNNVWGYDDVSSAEQTAGDTEYRCVAVKNESVASLTDLKVKLVTLGTQRTSDTAQLPASGAGTIQTSGSFADWPEQGYVAVKTSGGTLREVAYYTSRTGTVLTIPAAGREIWGTAAAGAATDTVDAVPGIALMIEAPSSQPAGTFSDGTATEGTGPTSPSFSVPITDAEALAVGTLASGNIYSLWLERIIPAGATACTDVLNHVRWLFDAA